MINAWVLMLACGGNVDDGPTTTDPCAFDLTSTSPRSWTTLEAVLDSAPCVRTRRCDVGFAVTHGQCEGTTAHYFVDGELVGTTVSGDVSGPGVCATETYGISLSACDAPVTSAACAVRPQMLPAGTATFETTDHLSEFERDACRAHGTCPVDGQTYVLESFPDALCPDSHILQISAPDGTLVSQYQGGSFVGIALHHCLTEPLIANEHCGFAFD